MVAAANDGGGGTGSAENVKGFKVAYDDLTAVANGAKGHPIDMLDQARAQVSAAKLPSGSFGPSSEANGIVKYWNAALDQRYKEIGTCMNVIAGMATKLQHTLDNYLAAEWKSQEEVEHSKKEGGEELNKMPRELHHDYPKVARENGR